MSDRESHQASIDASEASIPAENMVSLALACLKAPTSRSPFDDPRDINSGHQGVPGAMGHSAGDSQASN